MAPRYTVGVLPPWVKGLPVAAALPRVERALRNGSNVVVEAPAGAGKTTGIALPLLSFLRPGEQAFVVQPRRLAAKMAARRVASVMGTRLGEQIGYHVRFDQKRGPATRILFMTDGIAVRRLHDLEGVACVVLDEFHERKLDTEVLLTVIRHRQRRGLPSPRLVVMSATLNAGPVADYLEAPRIATEGRRYPVEVRYAPPKPGKRTKALAAQVQDALASLVAAGTVGAEADGGHVLVFLPGIREIRECADACETLAVRAGLTILPLHGNLDPQAQERAVAGDIPHKLVLATNVAETSITIDGVVAVVDSGVARVASHDPSTGIGRLQLSPISRASAAQRCGRAGRTGPGVCVRLFSRHDHDRRPEYDQPEISRLDLTAALMRLSTLGIEDPSRLAWLTSPPSARLAQAAELLRRLGAVDDGGAPTSTGNVIDRFGLHPRLARVMVEAERLGVSEGAAKAVAMISEGPRARPTRVADRDATVDPLEQWRAMDARGTVPSQVRRVARGLIRDARRHEDGRDGHDGHDDDDAIAEALLLGHPDRVARVRDDGPGRRTLVFSDGGSSPLAPSSVVQSAAWAVALAVDERREGTHRKIRVTAAAAIDPDWLVEHFVDDIADVVELRFDAKRGAVVGHSELRYGSLILETKPLAQLPENAWTVLADAVAAMGPGAVCEPAALESLRHRAAFAHAHEPGIAPLEEAAVDRVLRTMCRGHTQLASLRRTDFVATLRASLGPAAHRLDQLAPETVRLPRGRKLRVHYEPDRPPWVSSRLQDFFGMDTGPTVAQGAVPLVLHLLAPNRRAVQVTTDLAGFWTRHYPELRRQLMRRYPKHAWPETPG